MAFVALIVSVLAVGLGIALFRVRKRADRGAFELQQRVGELARTRDELSETHDLKTEAELRNNDLQRELSNIEREADNLQDELANAHAELETALEHHRAELEDLNEELDQSDALAEEQSAELASLAIETEELKAAMAAAVAEAHQTARTSGGGAVDPATLWRLELARSERTWRHSVAIYPDDVSPFPESEDLLALAVDVEVAALRDEVGAFLSLDWKAKPVEDVARSLLILRVAQELLAKASRLAEPAILEVSTGPEGEVILRLVPGEDGDMLTLDLRDFEERGFCSNGLVVPSQQEVTVLNLR